MNVKTLSMMAGLGGALLLAAPSQASFTGISAEQIFAGNTGVAIPEGFVTLRIYANFDNAMDRGIGVVGSPSNPLLWTAAGGTFFDSDAGTANDQAPSDSLLGLPGFESLNWDSWFAIGTDSAETGGGLVVAPGTEMAPVFNGATSWDGGPGGSTNVAWTRTPDDDLTLAGDDLQVLLAQITVAVDNIDALLVEGTMGLLIQEDGVNSEVAGSFSFIPAPGALALLGLAGLAGTRRRRA